MKTKFKLPKFLKVKRKRLRATAARRPLRIAAAAAAADYDDMAEPNMKLSRALLIVLLLHIVAVAGIIAFNAIKTRQGSIVSASVATNPANQTVGSTTKPITSTSSSATTTQNAENKSTHSTVKQTKDAKLPASSGKSYVVAKGDNPVTIAKKFKVSYDDLLALNHIDDPRKLKIGQKLLLPSKVTKGKKGDD
jgi:LysM repeat protein